VRPHCGLATRRVGWVSDGRLVSLAVSHEHDLGLGAGDRRIKEGAIQDFAAIDGNDNSWKLAPLGFVGCDRVGEVHIPQEHGIHHLFAFIIPIDHEFLVCTHHRAQAAIQEVQVVNGVNS